MCAYAGKGLPVETVREEMTISMRGEMTIPSKVTRFALNDKYAAMKVHVKLCLSQLHLVVDVTVNVDSGLLELKSCWGSGRTQTECVHA